MDVKLPFLDTDFNKKGELKRVRGRVLRKLMKYDFRAIFPALLPCLCGLLLAGIIIGLSSLGMDGLEKGVWLVLWSMLFFGLAFMVLYFSVVIPFKRYHKNFFQEEGYLTLTLPASAEEHLFAKHLSGIISLLIAAVGILLSSTVLFLCSGLSDFYFLDELMKEIGLLFLEAPVRFIEETILYVEGIIAVFTVGGAIVCLMRRFPVRRHSAILLLGVFILVFIFSNLLRIPALQDLFQFFATPAGEHVGAVLRFLFTGGLIVLSVWYELRTLKTNINLK
ncbi:MAG: hypothetical protein IJ506_00485 [Clostridia bacterium]|nr:hypothetical protein [Clostridia bacterium]